MYLQHFGLNTYPFSTTPDPRFYVPTPKHREALACLIYGVEQEKGFALVTGEIGTGKTMLCHAALRRLGQSVAVAMVVNPVLSPLEFLETVASEFGLETERGESKSSLLKALREFLMKCRQRGRTPVLMVDEAQDLSTELLEEIRLLGNFQTPEEKLLQVVLVGQPELRRIMRSDRLNALTQRIALKFHLGRLSAPEVSRYIERRLELSGASDPELFCPGARRKVFEASKGIPRVVNIICDQALLQAYVEEAPTVNVQVVEQVISEMEGYYMDSEEGLAPAAPGQGLLWDGPNEPVEPDEACPPEASCAAEEAEPEVVEDAEEPTEEGGASHGPQCFYEGIDGLCAALTEGDLSVRFPAEEKQWDLASYASDGLEVTVKLARTPNEAYAALVAEPSDPSIPEPPPPSRRAVASMGYIRMRPGTYLRGGQWPCTLKVGHRSLGFACAVGESGDAASLVEALRRLNSELGGLLRWSRNSPEEPSEQASPEEAAPRPAGKPEPDRRQVRVTCQHCGAVIEKVEKPNEPTVPCPECGTGVEVRSGTAASRG